MPRRDDLSSILVIGSGPDRHRPGLRVRLLGHPGLPGAEGGGLPGHPGQLQPGHHHDRPRYGRPDLRRAARPRSADAIIEQERPDALLPTLGGQTGLNLTMALVERGVLERYGVEVIGARPEAIATAEDRDRFKAAMEEIGLEVPASGFAHSLRRGAWRSREEIGLPHHGAPELHPGRARAPASPTTATHFGQLAAEGLAASPVGQILVEQSIAGWKEYELEVMRDEADNCVVVCSIENFDPMGVHTGDSITVAPAQTLTDVEYQAMRDDAFACLRRVGVETGGSNVQFAVDPADGGAGRHRDEPAGVALVGPGLQGHRVPHRQDRGPAGRRLPARRDPQRHHRATPASFEPTIDYVVTKMPRWAFEKLPGADGRLGTRMQSVGEVMAIGRTFCESLQKALRSLEQGRAGLNADPAEAALRRAGRRRAAATGSAWPPPSGSSSWRRRCAGASAADGVVAAAPASTRGSCDQHRRASSTSGPGWPGGSAPRRSSRSRLAPGQAPGLLRRPARLPARRSGPRPRSEPARLAAGVGATFKTVDTCAAEFEAFTPYHYATYEDEDEVQPVRAARVVILGSGPNRIGQGIEFDYCCVHASHGPARRRLRDGHDQLQPRDGLDRLRHLGPPLLRAAHRRGRGQRPRRRAGRRRPVAGVIVAPRRPDAAEAGRHRCRPELVLGTSPGLDRPGRGPRALERAVRAPGDPPAPGRHGRRPRPRRWPWPARVGYPVLVRPSYVLGGRAMEIVYDDDGVRRVMQAADQPGRWPARAA